MDFVTFVILYLSATAALIFILLFGEAPQFSRTPLPRLHYLVTVGWAEALEWLVKRVCGERGLRGLDAATECCCERSNPTLQIAYLSIISVGYYLYSSHFFSLLPNDTAAGYHVYTGTAAVCLCLTTFVLASLSDPGKVTAATAAPLLAAYPPDGRLFKAQACRTCQLPRPGRSKHCSSCSGCIARFDHHCGWINNCVGLSNTRHFLGFLGANLGLCLYGALLGPQVMLGELHRRGTLDIWVRHPHSGQPVPLYSLPSRFAEWLLYYYPIQLALVVFMLAAAAILAFFLAYQSWNICQGHTAYEVHKHRQLLKQAAAAAEGTAEQQQEQQVAGGGVGGSEATAPSDTSAAAPRSSQQHPGSSSRSSSRGSHHWAAYDRGPLLNWLEVLAPHHFLALQQHRTEQQQEQPVQQQRGAGSRQRQKAKHA